MIESDEKSVNLIEIEYHILRNVCGNWPTQFVPIAAGCAHCPPGSLCCGVGRAHIITGDQEQRPRPSSVEQRLRQQQCGHPAEALPGAAAQEEEALQG